MARILVVDDSAVIRDLLIDFLSEIDHQVDSAMDGAEGLEKARTGDYDLCICDLHLPRKNGYQLFTELGSDRGAMQFVFTDSLPDDLAEQVQENTGFAYLLKPFDLQEVREVVEQALEKIRAQ